MWPNLNMVSDYKTLNNGLHLHKIPIWFGSVVTRHRPTYFFVIKRYVISPFLPGFHRRETHEAQTIPPPPPHFKWLEKEPPSYNKWTRDMFHTSYYCFVTAGPNWTGSSLTGRNSYSYSRCLRANCICRRPLNEPSNPSILVEFWVSRFSHILKVWVPLRCEIFIF